MLRTLNLYLAHNWARVLLASAIIAVLVSVACGAGVLIDSNNVTQNKLEKRFERWIEVSGNITPEEVTGLVDTELSIIPTVLTHLEYPLMWGRTALLPVYGMTEANAAAFLELSDTQLTADSILPDGDALYLPADFLAARNGKVGEELEETQRFQHPHQYLIEGIVEGDLSYGLAAFDTISSLSSQEQAFIVSSPQMESGEIEAIVKDKLKGRSDIRVIGPGYYRDLASQRSREASLLKVGVMAILSIFTGIAMTLLVRRERRSMAVEQQLSRLYFGKAILSLYRPLIAGLAASVGGWVLGVGFSAVILFVIRLTILAPKGLAFSFPGTALWAGVAFTIVTLYAQIGTWIQALRQDQAMFLQSTPIEIKPEIERKTVHPGQIVRG